MDQNNLLELIDAFYSGGFELPDAIAVLGDGTPPEQVTPHRLKLAPRDPLLRAASLETVDPVAPATDPVLAGVVLETEEPVLLELSALVARFGEPREVPRLKPHDPRTVQLLVRGTAREGYMLVAVEPGDENGVLRRIRRVILRRYPPGSQRPAAQ